MVLAVPLGQVVLWASSYDPRMAAFWLFWTGILAIPSLVLLRSLWRSSADYEREQWSAQELERRLRRLDADHPVGPLARDRRDPRRTPDAARPPGDAPDAG